MRKFVRTRPAPPAPPALPSGGHSKDPARHLNGHANGVNGGARRDDRSTLSRCGPEGGGWWEDAEFPPRAALGPRAPSAVRWLRPHEMCARPRFRGDDAPATAAPHHGDGHDGDDGDGGDDLYEEDDLDEARWSAQVGAEGVGELCTALAALATAPALLARLVPPGQGFGRLYRGVFRFRFWVWGEWVEVGVDDRLPARDAGGVLYSRGALADDFTLPLLEKAYAKLYGSYWAARGGRGRGREEGGGVARALMDLSGGIVQSFSLRRQPPALTLQVLAAAVPRSTLVLARGGQAAYRVTGLAPAPPAPALVRLRRCGAAPGPAPASSDELAPYPAPHLRDDLQDGEFWVSFEELARSLQWLELVHVGPDDWAREPALRRTRPWRAALARRRWRPGLSDGGPPSAETTGTNPQFHVQVCGARCHAVVALAQRYHPRAAPDRTVGFAVYELPAAAPPARPERALHRLRALEVAHESRSREVATFFTLPAGRYLVVPHARRSPSSAGGAFLLRIFTDHHAVVWEVNEDNVVLRDISEDAMEDIQLFPAEVRNTIHKILAKCDFEEVEAEELGRIVRPAAGGRVSRGTAAALAALASLAGGGGGGAGGGAWSGRVPRRALPRLLARLAAWRAAFLSGVGPAPCRLAGVAPAPAHRLRDMLRAAGLTASNKVLESVVVRHCRGGRLSADGFNAALARLLLAHERYRALESRFKSNPLSLEEMILMTIYS